jgi:hypothetical protein
MDSMTPPPQVPPQIPPTAKKGMGTGAKVGIGCGIVAAVVVIGLIILGWFMAPRLKKFAEDPTRSTAELMVSTSRGNFELVAEDDANKRYTVKDKSSGTLTTIYWDEKASAPKIIQGDFSAIPAGTPLPGP